MARGQEVRFTFIGESGGLVTATRTGAKGVDDLVKAHEKLGSAAAKSTARAGQFASAIGQTATTLSRSASAFGLPVGHLRALDDVADVAALGLNSMSTSATGLAAALGPVAVAVAAVAASVRLLKPAFDEAVASGQALPHEVQEVVNMAKEAAKVQAAVAATRTEIAARFASIDITKEVAAQRALAEQYMAMGVSASEIRDRIKDIRPEIDAWLKSTEKLTAEKKRVGEEAARAASQAQEAWQRAAESARAAWDGFFKGLEAGTAEAQRDIIAVMGARAIDRADVDLSDWMARTGFGSDEVAGPPTDLIVTAASATERWAEALEKTTQALSLASQALQFLGVSANNFLVRALNTIGEGMSLGGEIGGMFGPQGAVIGAVAGGVVGLFKGLFGGGGPSREEREAARRQAEAERKRIQDLAASSRAAGIAGVAELGGAFFEGRRPAAGTVLTADDARRQGAIFAAAWGAVVKEKGIVGAAEAFGEAFKNLSADMAAAGVDLPDWLKEIGSLVELGMDEQFQHIAEAANTAAKFLESVAAAGVVDEEVFRAFEQEARAAFGGGKQRAAELGMDDAAATKAGFAAANPLLKALLDESIVSGTALSADIQAMIDAAGITASVNVQQLDELRQIRAAVQAIAGTGGGMISTDMPGGDTFKNLPKFAKGGDTDDPWVGLRHSGGAFLGVLHPNETVVPDSQAVAFAQSVLGSTNSGSVASALATLAAEVRGRPSVTVEQPVTLNLQVGPGTTRAQIDQTVAAIEEALAENRSAIPRLLVKAGFVRK